MRWWRHLRRAYADAIIKGAVRRLAIGAGDVLVVRMADKLSDDNRQRVVELFDRIKAHLRTDFTVVILDGGVDIDVLTAADRGDTCHR